MDEVCELCGYERKYAIKLLTGKRAIFGSKGRKRGDSQLFTGSRSARQKVLKASAASIDRLLAPCRASQERELVAARAPEPFCANRFRVAPNIGM